MNENQLHHLFQAFVQVHDPAQRDHYGGTGLGLVLCQRFATLLDGSITVTSVAGQGTRFVVRIPREISVQPIL